MKNLLVITFFSIISCSLASANLCRKALFKPEVGDIIYPKQGFKVAKILQVMNDNKTILIAEVSLNGHIQTGRTEVSRHHPHLGYAKNSSYKGIKTGELVYPNISNIKVGVIVAIPINGYSFAIKNLAPNSSEDTIHYLRIDQFGRADAEVDKETGLRVNDIVTVRNSEYPNRHARIVGLTYNKYFQSIVYRYLDETEIFRYQHASVLDAVKAPSLD